MKDLNWISWVTCCSFHISTSLFTLHFYLRQMTSFLKPYEPTSASFTFLQQLPHLSVMSLCDPMHCRTSGFTISRSLLKLLSTESVMPSNHLILCRPLLLLPSVFPSIRVFSNESVLCIRLPEYCSINFSICPSNAYSRLISFRIDWLISLQTKGLSRVFSNTTVQKRHKGGVISEVIDISPGNLNSSLSFIKPAFCMMYSAYKLKKQGDSIQSWRTPSPVWNSFPIFPNMSSSNCCFLTWIQISQEAGKVVWYSHLFQNFPQFVVIHRVKGFGIVNKAEVDVFLELSCFFYDPMDVGNLISGSSAFSKTSWTSGSSQFMYSWA